MPDAKPRAPFGTCQAPKILGAATCGRWIQVKGARTCREHAGTDSKRRCEAQPGKAGGRDRGRCHAWPLVDLPFCDAHDPQRQELRRQERASAAARLQRLKKALAGGGPAISRQVLELLLLEGKVKIEDVEALLIRYRVSLSLTRRGVPPC